MPVVGQHFESEIATLRDRVNQRLERYVEPVADCPTTLRESMAYSLLAGGKRLRPILVLLSCQACGGSIEAAFPSACAIEMIHTYSLIHDDLPAMDNDDYRRGRLTNHKVYGEGMAILAGDALLTLAFEVIARETEPASVAAACCADLASAAGWCGMVGGQVADLEAENRLKSSAESPRVIDDPEIMLQQLEAIHRRKTGRLLTSAVTLGARVAQANNELINRLDQFGKHVGLAFQIADDLLDVVGDAAKMGKTVGKDATLGKMTYPALLGVEESRRRADQLINSACALLEPLGERAIPLADLARFITRRDH